MPGGRRARRAARTAAVVVLAGLGLAATPTAAPPAPSSGSLRDGDAGFQIVIAPDWRPLEPPSGTLVAYQAPDQHAVLALTRVAVGSRSPRTFPLVVDEIERGVEGATRAYHRLRRRTGHAGRARTLDLLYERAASPAAAGDGAKPHHHHHHHRARVLSRYLLYHTYSVVLSIGLDPGASHADRRAARAMLASFTTFPP